MAFTLSGIQVAIRGALRSVYEWPVVMLGLSSSGTPVPVLVGTDGSIATTGTLPAGAATAANQATQITAEQAILAKLPGSTARTFALASTTSGSGTIMAGANSGSIILSADFVGSIAGTAIDMTVTGPTAVPFAGIDIPLNGNDTLVGVAFTRSAGTIWYTTVT